MQQNKSVAGYLADQITYKAALEKLRAIITSTDLQETVKWGIPTYTIHNKNVLSISSFKNHFGIWFFNGALLKDTHKKLINAQEGKTQAMRQLRFKSINEIDESLILNYVNEAIANQKKGLEIKSVKKALVIPPELKIILESNTSLKMAFEALLLSKKREFCNYISEAKRSETKQKRLDKIKPMILKNIGLNDKYKN